MINTTLSAHHMSIHDLTRLIGKLLSCTVSCVRGQGYCRYLEQLKIHSLHLNMWHWNATCQLDQKSCCELMWWLKNLPNSIAPIHHPNPELEMTSDTCNTGWGAHFNQVSANGHFSPAELPLSINTKEILAIWYGLCCFKEHFKNKHILLKSDSTTAIRYIKKFGGMQSNSDPKYL